MSMVNPEFLRQFRDHADSDGTMPFDTFMQLVLYAPEIGYYVRERKRTGLSPDADFFTSTNTGPLFGKLVTAGICHLLQQKNLQARDYHFIEIGAEDNAGILSGLTHPFASARCIRIGNHINIKGPCIVFSNELFDAQPFRRFVTDKGIWREIGVREKDAELSEVFLERSISEPWLPDPKSLPDAYHLDAPLAASELAATIAAQPWQGLFIAIDYGKSFNELASITPQGTLRAYKNHRQHNDLLANPTEQDLTGHICWDWISDALVRHSFGNPQLQSQESFFMRHAAPAIQQVMMLPHSKENTPHKAALQQLLHPAQLGQKFEVLCALR